jgi:hypothetical protein
VGEDIRKRINDAKKQIQPAADQGKPTVLLIFNNRDPLQLFGTEDFDFVHAYGELTVTIETNSGKMTDWFHGQNQSFQPRKTTSFSAAGRLKEDRGSISVTLFENIHANVPLERASRDSSGL